MMRLNRVSQPNSLQIVISMMIKGFQGKRKHSLKYATHRFINHKITDRNSIPWEKHTALIASVEKHQGLIVL